MARLAQVVREAAWLAGFGGLSLLVTGWLLGFRAVWPPGATLDIQMHNTYLVLPKWQLLLPLFLASATPVTWGRAAQAGYQQRATNVVLAGLVLLAGLLLVVLAAGVWQGLHRP